MNVKRVSSTVAVWCICAVSVATAACDRRAPSAPGGPATVQRVVILGDSLAVSPTMDESFPARLQERVDDLDLPWTITNASDRGDTSSDGLDRLDAVLTDDVGVLVVALGANDGLRGVDLGVIEKHLSAIIRRAQDRGIAVLLCGMEAPPVRGWEYSLGFHRIFPRLADRHGVPLVPFLLTGVLLNPDFNERDLIHPNAAGARRIAQTVWPYLELMLNERSGTPGTSGT